MANSNKLSPIEERNVLAELARRKRTNEAHIDSKKPTQAELELADRLSAQMFGPQRKFFDSKRRLRVGFCSRRAGKTVGLLIHYLRTMLRHPTSDCLYIAQTAKAARLILWKELKDWVSRYELPFEFNENLLQMRHSRGGGTLVLMGAEKRDEIEKLRGAKWKVAALDEAATFGAHIEALIVEVIGPALRDEDGDLILIGTSGRVKAGLFYEACHELRLKKDGSPVFELHKWDLTQNEPLRLKNPRAVDLELIMEEEGLTPEDPRFLREYRMLWAAGEDERLFSGFKEERNVWDAPTGVAAIRALPAGHDWKLLLGLDFGWQDECAITCVAYSATHSCIYVIDTWSKKHAYSDEVADAIFAMRGKYGVRRYIGDVGGYGKAMQMQLQRDYGIQITAAQKQEKLAFIEFFNSALRRGDVQVQKDQEKLIEQLLLSSWNEDHTDAANHQRDDLVFSCVYGWRYAKFSGAGKQSLPERSKYSPQQQAALREKSEALAAKPQQQQQSWFDADSGGSAGANSGSVGAWRDILGTGKP